MSPTEDKCIRCSKHFFPNQNAIKCDNCEGWLHLRCSGMKLRDFKMIREDTEYICEYCVKYPCGKC